ncbi:MAG: hypothetical protein LBJ17_03240, partial [Dysgonamonadaceae bacterium]|nr:hypothetical protein [Dysgonamonadaceae bacterium]
MQVNSKKILTAIIILVAAISQSRGQVTVGALTEPQTFSILELESGGERGLRLPQLITEERDELDLTSSPVAATGLTIFNLDTQCVETWNGTEWISQCAMCGDSPCIYYPPNPPTAEPNSGIDMYIGVMYDFQYQTIQSYSIGGTPESYQWYVKRKGEPDSKYRGLSGATGSSYTVPSNFIKDTFQPIISEKSNDYNDSIVFVCFAKFSGNTIKRTPEAGIEFIGTNTAGYGT